MEQVHAQKRQTRAPGQEDGRQASAEGVAFMDNGQRGGSSHPWPYWLPVIPYGKVLSPGGPSNHQFWVQSSGKHA